VKKGALIYLDLSSIELYLVSLELIYFFLCKRYRTSQLDLEKLEAVRNREELRKLREEESERAIRAEVRVI
jgi:hypothetical protein